MRKQTVILLATIAVAFVVVVLVATHWALTRNFGPPQKPGEYGDMFGIAEAIFSGMALTAAFITLWYTGQEVRATLAEIAQTQVEHRQAAELQALASLIDAVDTAIERGDPTEYRFEGRDYRPTDLRPVLLARLLTDYEEVIGRQAGPRSR